MGATSAYLRERIRCGVVVANFFRNKYPLLVGARAPEWYLVRRRGLVIITPRSQEHLTASIGRSLRAGMSDLTRMPWVNKEDTNVSSSIVERTVERWSGKVWVGGRKQHRLARSAAAMSVDGVLVVSKLSGKATEARI